SLLCTHSLASKNAATGTRPVARRFDLDEPAEAAPDERRYLPVTASELAFLLPLQVDDLRHIEALAVAGLERALRLHDVSDFLHALDFLGSQDRAEGLRLDSVANHFFARNFLAVESLERRFGDEVGSNQLCRFLGLVLQQLDGVSLRVQRLPDGILALLEHFTGRDHHHAGERPFLADLVDLRDRSDQLGNAGLRLEQEGSIDAVTDERLDRDLRAHAHDVDVSLSQAEIGRAHV